MLPLRTYMNIKPESRLMELELIAFRLMTGEDVEQTLECFRPDLAKEYANLLEGEQ